LSQQQRDLTHINYPNSSQGKASPKKQFAQADRQSKKMKKLWQAQQSLLKQADSRQHPKVPLLPLAEF
jgi:hypothetical protein